MRRAGDGLDYGAYRTRWVYPATDGEVSITLVCGAASPQHGSSVVALNAIAVHVGSAKVRLRIGVALLRAQAEEARSLRKVA